jgi:hypothetical protein
VTPWWWPGEAETCRQVYVIKRWIVHVLVRLLQIIDENAQNITHKHLHLCYVKTHVLFPPPSHVRYYLIRRLSIYYTKTCLKIRLQNIYFKWRFLKPVKFRKPRRTTGGRKRGYPLQQVVPASLSGETRLVWFPTRQTRNIASWQRIWGFTSESVLERNCVTPYVLWVYISILTAKWIAAVRSQADTLTWLAVGPTEGNFPGSQATKRLKLSLTSIQIVRGKETRHASALHTWLGWPDVLVLQDLPFSRLGSSFVLHVRNVLFIFRSYLGPLKTLSNHFPQTLKNP